MTFFQRNMRYDSKRKKEYIFQSNGLNLLIGDKPKTCLESLLFYTLLKC